MTEDDPSMKLEVALAWAINAKNSMQNHSGFSPIQLVLGTNPNLPSVSTNRLPAMENLEKSEAVIKHLTALHAAKRAFTKAELSERIHIALKHKVRAMNSLVMEIKYFSREMVVISGGDLVPLLVRTAKLFSLGMENN